MRRVAVFSLGGIGNFGDEIIGETTAWLIRSLRPDLEVLPCELHPRLRDYPLVLRGDWFLGRALRLLYRSGFFRRVLGSRRLWFDDLTWRVRVGRYGRNRLARADALVYAIGMIKFRNQGHSSLAALLNAEAQRRGIPVMLSAGSVARADSSDSRFLQLQRALRLPVIRAISSRDGETGVERLRRDYGLDLSDLSAVGDPAFWIPECFDIRSAPADRSVIGVNLARHRLFADYDGGASDDELIAFYGALGRELDRRGYRWVLFSNGMAQDERFGRELLAAHGWPAERLLPRPKNVREFCLRVNSFACVFAIRLHAALTSWALGVPVAGIAWDDKIRLVARTLGEEGRFLGSDALDVARALDVLEAARANPVDRSRITALREATRSALARFLDRELPRAAAEEGGAPC